MDHISNLPDGVLCHILSFLTTKEAALTSILAKRWLNLVAFVPCLTIDDTVFLHPEKGKRDREDMRQSFMNFVERVLALQIKFPLKRFSLNCFTVVDMDRVDGWISSVLARGVSDLDLQIINNEEFYQLSPKWFECSTLVSLKISFGIDIGWVAGSVSLPLLKTLVLDWVMVSPTDFVTLLHALPSLDELVLVDVMWKDMEDVTVSSASLKTLTIKLNEWLYALSFDTPSLVHFEYSGLVALDYPVVNMGNLVDAQINFSEIHIKQLGEPDNPEDALRFSNVSKLFLGMRNVPNLSLLPITLQGLSMLIFVFTHTN
ncbi:F-box protein At3g59000 isoform X2 [Raphanus sativus]|uniref:F-box protein At3g59000 isoform X2 n=1 Tax=Raphanus sativus TaxID=3726 RepID=A0A9W3C5F1_RAPSA|nr:F-box protein At3g59000 isoform X2 [Raphanus sativus]